MSLLPVSSSQFLFRLNLIESFRANYGAKQEAFKKGDGDPPLCTPLSFSENTGHSALQRHLVTHHCDEWVTKCDANNWKIKAGGDEVLMPVEAAHVHLGTSGASGTSSVPSFTKDNFINAIVEFFCSADVSFNTIENQQL